MSSYFIETPFDNFLIFDISGDRIRRIIFSTKNAGLSLFGEIKRLMVDVFDKKDLTLFDYSMIDFDETKKSYALYKFLIKTKSGETYSYSQTAEILFNSRNYARAVATMLHANPFVFLVPCHRVIAENGIGGYGSGVDLKLKILNWENAL